MTNIAIIGGATVKTVVDADHRIGQMSFVLHGDIPEDLVVNIRERRKPFKNEPPNWKFKNKANFTLQAFD